MASKSITYAQRVAMKTNPINDVNEYELISTFFTDLFANNLYKLAKGRVGSNNNKLSDEYCSIAKIYADNFKTSTSTQDKVIESFFKFYNMYKQHSNMTNQDIVSKIVSIYTMDKLSQTQRYEILCNVFSMLMTAMVSHVCSSSVLSIILTDRSTPQAKAQFHKNIRATQDFCIQTLVDYKFTVRNKFRGDDNSHYIKEIKQLKKTLEEYTEEMEALDEENADLNKKIKKLSASAKDLKDQNEKLVKLVGMMNERMKLLPAQTAEIDKEAERSVDAAKPTVTSKPTESTRHVEESKIDVPIVEKPRFILPANKPSFNPFPVKPTPPATTQYTPPAKPTPPPVKPTPPSTTQYTPPVRKPSPLSIITNRFDKMSSISEEDDKLINSVDDKVTDKVTDKVDDKVDDKMADKVAENSAQSWQSSKPATPLNSRLFSMLQQDADEYTDDDESEKPNKAVNDDDDDYE
jgi:hypothetical protein